MSESGELMQLRARKDALRPLIDAELKTIEKSMRLLESYQNELSFIDKEIVEQTMVKMRTV